MASTDVLQRTDERQSVPVGRFSGLRLLLAEYRRAMAAEDLYERLRCAGPTTRKVPRTEIARAVFDKIYSR
jgi:hypothetical protein